MRVTGGIGRGQRLKVPAGDRVRPTSDKVKQALFNILGDKVVDSVVLDLFAGAGGIGIEALAGVLHV
jgi:16S rRNA (guanine966-N2)-methyltransferase